MDNYLITQESNTLQSFGKLWLLVRNEEYQRTYYVKVKKDKVEMTNKEEIVEGNDSKRDKF